MTSRVTAAFLSLLALTLVLIAPAQGQLALPARAPDYVGSTGWVDEQPWDLETQLVNDNCQTYPLLLPVAPADTIAVTYRMAPDYAYDGDVFVGSSGSPTQFVGGSWNMLSLSHRPNVIAGPGFNNPVCPMPYDGWPINAPTVGASNNLAFAVWPMGSTAPLGVPAGAATFRTEILAPNPATSPVGYGPTNVPAYQESGYWNVQEWKTVNGTRAGRDFHRLWVTPSTDPNMSWYSIAGGQSYSHTVAYSMKMQARMRLAVWYVRPADVLANPATIAP